MFPLRLSRKKSPRFPERLAGLPTACCFAVSALVLTAPLRPVVGAEAGAAGPAATNPGDMARAAEEQSRFADGLYRRELYRMAAAEYEKLIREYPAYSGAPNGYFYWGESLRLLGEKKGAARVFEELRRRFPAHPLAVRAGVHRASMLLDEGANEDALKLLKGLDLTGQPGNIADAGLYYLAVANNRLGHIPEAASAFSKLAALPLDKSLPLRAHARLSLAFLKRNQGDTAGALKLLGELTESDAVAVEVVQEALAQTGDLHLFRKDHAAAVAAYRRLLREFPRSSFAEAARRSCGWALFELKRYQDVLALFEQTSGQPLDISPETLYLQGACDKRLARWASAATQFRRVLTYATSPYRIYAHFEILECLYQQHDFADCVPQARSFLAENPKHEHAADAAYFLGQSLVELKRFPEAAKAYEQALKDYWGEWEYRESAILILADVYRQMKAFDRAAATYRRLLEIKDSTRHVDAYLQAGECEILAGNLVAAFADYRQLVTDHADAPEAAVAALRMAEIAIQQRSYAEAADILTAFLEHHPQHPLVAKALYLRGSMLYRLGKMPEAIADLRRSVAMPDFPEKKFARLFLAYALWEEAKTDEALGIFESLLKSGQLDDDFTPALLNEIGDRYLEANNFAAAAACYRILAKQGDKDLAFIGQLGLGRLEAAKGRHEEARRIFAALKEQAPTGSDVRAQALAYLGEALRALGSDDEAMIAFEESLKLGAGDLRAMALARVGLAKLYAAKGREESALRYATSAFVLYDDDEYSPEAMLLAMRILIKGDRFDEAKMTYQEFKTRYPVALADFRNRPENQDIFKHF